MFVSADVHRVAKIEMDQPRQVMEGSPTRSITIRITDDRGNEFEIDLFGPTADALTVKPMED